LSYTRELEQVIGAMAVDGLVGKLNQ